MPKLGRGLGLASLPNRILEVYLPITPTPPSGDIVTDSLFVKQEEVQQTHQAQIKRGIKRFSILLL